MDDFNLEEQLIQDAKEQEKNEILLSLESWNTIREMNISVEWIVDRLIPKDSIILLFGKGGIGKTWLSMDMSRAIASGTPFLGLCTIKTTVIFVDFENPVAVLNARTQKLGEADGVYFWRVNNPKMKAPKLDHEQWELYKELPKESVIIFDTLRASQNKDENASKDMGLIMERAKELRDLGFTIILLHHTAKNSDKVPKGSTAIVDLADHILGLTLVRKKVDGQEIIVDDEDNDGDLLYRFGIREKTRFEPYQIYLTLNPDRGFELAPDPQEDTLKKMAECLSSHECINKTDFLKECKTQTGLADKKVRRLFDIGQGRYWKTEKIGSHNSQMVTPIQFGSFLTPIGSEKLKNGNSVLQPKEKTDSFKTQKSLDDIEFGSFSKVFCQSEKQDIIQVEEIL